MANRPLLKPFHVITNGNMSGNLISIPTILNGPSMVSYQCDWSGTSPVGTVTVEVSNNYSQDAVGNVLNAGTWNTLPLSAVCAVSGNTGNGFIDITLTSPYAIRLVYTAGSGTGTMNAIVKAGVT